MTETKPFCLKDGRLIEAVFFDVGETLIYPYPPVGETYSATAARHGIFIPPEEMERLFRRHWHELVEQTALAPERYLQPLDPGGKRWWRMLVERIIGSAADADAIGPLFEQLYDYYASGSAWRIYPDVVPALTALSGKGLHLGVISNWDSRLERILSELGLRVFFSIPDHKQLPGISEAASGDFSRSVAPGGRQGRALDPGR